MTSFLNKYFDSIGHEKFKFIGPLISIIADMILIYYALNILIPMMVTDDLIKKVMIERIGPNAIINSDFIESTQQMMRSGMSVLLTGVLIFNFSMGIFSYKGKDLATRYFKGYTLSTAIVSVIELGYYAISVGEFNQYTFFTLLLYGFAALGFRHFYPHLKSSFFL